MTQMLRLFVAIPVSEPAHGAIASLIERGISVTHVQLMQSILQPQGAIHTERYRAMLM